MKVERVDTVVIGGGQAGLAVGYYLSRHNKEFVILDAGHRIGQIWRSRWDSLRLFTPACFNGLPGMPFPAPEDYLPTKDEMADYMEAYATQFKLPVQLGIRVDELIRKEGRYLITTSNGKLEAKHVVVATGSTATPYKPKFASQLDLSITQLHSVEYGNPEQLGNGAVLIVGAGNSGAEIALELSSRQQTLLAGHHPGHIPITLGCFAYKLMKLLKVNTWPGKWVAEKASGKGDPLIRVQPKDLIEANIQRVSRVVGVSNGKPLLEDGRIIDVKNVVWCTGFLANYSWIKLPVFSSNGNPIHYYGVVQTEPGLYFIGLRFQSSLVSHIVGGVGADAKYIVKQIFKRDKQSKRHI